MGSQHSGWRPAPFGNAGEIPPSAPPGGQTTAAAACWGPRPLTMHLPRRTPSSSLDGHRKVVVLLQHCFGVGIALQHLFRRSRPPSEPVLAPPLGHPDHVGTQLSTAAHASCLAMALAWALGRVGVTPDYVDATAHVTVAPQSGGFKITQSHLVCRAKVPGIDQATFMQQAEAAKAGCPVSQALASTEISLEATLLDKEAADPSS